MFCRELSSSFPISMEFQFDRESVMAKGIPMGPLRFSSRPSTPQQFNWRLSHSLTTALILLDLEPFALRESTV